MTSFKKTRDEGVSIVICCYNSAERLPETLAHLAAQQKPADLQMEVVLVNNRSTDNTTDIAEGYRPLFEKAGISITIIDEPKPGQMYARRKGVTTAAFDTVIFCDDDNWLNDSYAAVAWEVMESDKTIGAAGGRNSAFPEGEPPLWFDEYKSFYAVGTPAQSSGYVSHKTYVLGAGMVTRKHLFLDMFPDEYPTLLPGRTEESLSTGDDFEYCKRLLICGYTLYYDERMHLRHFIPKARMTIAYREKLMAGIREAGKILSEYDRAIHVVKKIRGKNRWRLWLMAPFRIWMAKQGRGRRVYEDEKLVAFFVAPTKGTGEVLNILKNFYYSHKHSK